MKRWMAILLAALLLCSALALAEEAAPAPEARQDAATSEPVRQTEATSETTPEAQPLWLLTIRYRYEDGSEAQPSLELVLAAGDKYDVESPEVAGCLPDVDRVTGDMPGADLTVDVVYRPDPAATAPTEAVATPNPDNPETNDPPEPGSPEATGSPNPGNPETTGSPEPDNPEATAAPNPGDPGATAAPGEGWTLTIHYVLPDGSPAAADYVQTGLASGQAYDVEPPAVEGMAADPARVSGVMGEADVTVTVRYGASGDFPGGFPGGGFPGGSHGGRPGGASGGMGSPEGAEAAEDPGFRVTPGEAFTSIHSSGDADDSPYTALDTDDGTVQALGLSLTADGAEQLFSAEWTDGALILSGGAGCWSVNGSALRALQNGGVETLVLVSGDAAAVLPTAGFASGYAYDCLRAQGLASSAFEYAVDPAAQTVQLTAQGATYALAREGGDVRLTGAAFGAASALCAQYVQDAE